LLETRNKTLKQETKAFISPPRPTRCIWSDWTSAALPEIACLLSRS
jgi:hypothetical protein